LPEQKEDATAKRRKNDQFEKLAGASEGKILSEARERREEGRHSQTHQ